MVVKRLLRLSTMLVATFLCSGARGDPFIFSGRPLVEGHPRYEHYRPALNRFPDLEACKAKGFLDPDGRILHAPMDQAYRLWRHDLVRGVQLLFSTE